MAKNFKILQRKDKRCLHLKLQGDFDGTSAFELINVLKETLFFPKICIHAENLKTICPFGSEVFEKHLNEFKEHSDKIFFIRNKKIAHTGKYTYMPKKSAIRKQPLQ